MMDGCFNRRPFRIEKIEGAIDLDVIPLLTVLLFPLTNLPCGSKRGYVQMNNEKTTERFKCENRFEKSENRSNDRDNHT